MRPDRDKASFLPVAQCALQQCQLPLAGTHGPEAQSLSNEAQSLSIVYANMVEMELSERTAEMQNCAAVGLYLFLLPDAMDSCHSLQVRLWIPIAVVEDASVGTLQIHLKPTPSEAGGMQHEQQ